MTKFRFERDPDPQWYGLDELREALVTKGYKLFNYSLNYKENHCNWIACKRTEETTRWCDCNDKPPQFVIKPYLYTFDDITSKGFTVDITGELDGDWFELSCYGLRVEDIEKLESIERKLVKAWNVLDQ